MTGIPEEFLQALERLKERFEQFPQLEAHSAVISNQYR